MIAASPEIQALLASSSIFFMADLYTFALKSGLYLRYADLDIDVPWGGNTFRAWPIQRSGIRRVRGLEVQTMDITIFVGPEDLIGTLPWLTAACLGALAGAGVTVERAFFTASYFDSPLGTVPVFPRGQVADCDFALGRAQIKCKGMTEILDTQMPRNLYTPGCPYTVFLGDCGLDPNAWQVTDAAGAGASVLSVPCSLAQSAGYFNLGAMRFTSGVNTGLARTIKTYTPGQIIVSRPWPQAPAAGDAFIAWPGCDKQKSTCETKFNNLSFRGFPYVPISTTAY